MPTQPTVPESRDLPPGFDPALAVGLGERLTHLAIPGGAVLMREGDPSDALYFVISGRLVAARGPAQAPVRLGEIARGEMIGEMSLAEGARRTATVLALRDSRLLRIDNDAFFELMRRDPSVARRLIDSLTRRVARPSSPRRQPLTTVALLPVHAGFDLAAFAHRLVRALAGRVRVGLLDAARFDAAFPGATTAPGGPSAAAWLDDQERACDLLLYVAHPAADAWSSLCVRQADRVLLVADAAADAAAGPAEAILRAADSATALRGVELALVRNTAAAGPRDTSRWLAGRALRRHHHVAADDDASFERLARHLAGHALGVAMSGGGARALSAIGVLRACEEQGVPIDTFGGSSMGAVVAALAAGGMRWRDIRDRVGHEIARRPFSGLGWPVTALLSGRRLARMTRSLFGASRIEDLPVRFFAVTCDLTAGALRVAEAGPLEHWVRASNTVPGILPPVLHEGHLLVDGGVLNNLPADLMAERNAGPVFAVNASGATPLTARLPDDADLSGFALFLRGRAAPVPRLPRILVRSMLLASANHAARVGEHAQRIIAPAMPGIDVADWHAFDTVVEAGYRAAMESLESWARTPTP